MRIRRSLATTAAVTSSSDPDHNNNTTLLSTTATTPRRCSNNTTTNKKTSSSIIVCVLNQSPWDVADLASSQLDGGLFSLTGTTSPVPELAIGSQSFGSSVKLCGRETKQPLVVAAASDKSSDRREDTNGVGLSPPEVKIKAEKSSAGGVVVSSNKPKIRSGSVKKTQPELNDSGTKRRGRPAKRLSADNPYEFYYYSGFGPHWGKKREAVTKPPVVANKQVIVPPDQELRNEGSAKRDIEFVEYDEDDDDDDDIGAENKEGTRRPGGRKRVKARSLKSLM